PARLPARRPLAYGQHAERTARRRRPRRRASGVVGVRGSTAVGDQLDSPNIDSLDQGSFEPRRVDKPWGHELIWALTDAYCGKVLVIETGRRLSYQMHEVKDEWIHVLSGRLLLPLEDDGGVDREHALGPGESAHVRTRRRH